MLKIRQRDLASPSFVDQKTLAKGAKSKPAKSGARDTQVSAIRNAVSAESAKELADAIATAAFEPSAVQSLAESAKSIFEAAKGPLLGGLTSTGGDTERINELFAAAGAKVSVIAGQSFDIERMRAQLADRLQRGLSTADLQKLAQSAPIIAKLASASSARNEQAKADQRAFFERAGMFDGDDGKLIRQTLDAVFDAVPGAPAAAPTRLSRQVARMMIDRDQFDSQVSQAAASLPKEIRRSFLETFPYDHAVESTAAILSTTFGDRQLPRVMECLTSGAMKQLGLIQGELVKTAFDSMTETVSAELTALVEEYEAKDSSRT